jgi:hypothetical protein
MDFDIKATLKLVKVDMDWIELAKRIVQWWAAGNTVMNLFGFHERQRMFCVAERAVTS